jgi:two-component sensor histidine kinase
MSEIGNGEWSRPQLKSLLRHAMGGHADIEAYEMDLVRAGHETRKIVITARKLAYDDEAQTRLLLTVVDVTDARAIDRQHDDLIREKAVLLQELQHRVANSLQIIASVLMQSARRSSSEEARGHIEDAHHRVMSIAALQKQLATSQVADVELRRYFTDLCRSISASMIRNEDHVSLLVVAAESSVPSAMSISLGLIVTELVINALKHGFVGRRSGSITVDYQTDGTAWTLSVTDNGVGMPAVKTDPGLGMSIIDALASQLKATVRFSDAKPGTCVTIAHAAG